MAAPSAASLIARATVLFVAQFPIAMHMARGVALTSPVTLHGAMMMTMTFFLMAVPSRGRGDLLSHEDGILFASRATKKAKAKRESIRPEGIL